MTLIRRILLILALAWSVAHAANGLSSLAGTPVPQTEAQRRIVESLNQPIPSFDFPNGDLVGTLSAISRSMGVPIIPDPDVSGKIGFQISGLTLRQLLTAACSANGVFYYIHPDGYVVVRAKIERIYPIDFLAAEKKVASSNTVSMLSSTSGSGNSSTTGSTMGITTSATAGVAGNGTNPGSQVSVTAKNDDSFWAEFETGLKSKIHDKSDVVLVNRTAGVLDVTAGIETHAGIQAYWRSVMSRVNRGVTVHVYVLNCKYKNADQLGFDWTTDPFRLGGIFGNAVRVGSSIVPASSTTGTTVGGMGTALNTITAVGSSQLGTPTFSGTVGVGKVNLFIQALQTQSEVKTSTAPSIGLLNNRTSIVQVSDDKNFFSQTDETIINDGATGTTTGGVTYTPVTRRKFSISQYSFGLFMPVTVQVSDQGIITLDLNPSLTDYAGVDVSQDGLQTAPQKTTHQFSTQVQLRSGEAYVMGGYMRSMAGKETRSTPGLSSIPWLGRLFRNEAKVSERGELMVVVEATLKDVPNPEPIEVYTPNPSEMVRPDLMLSLSEQVPVTPVSVPVVVDPTAPSVPSAPTVPSATSLDGAKHKSTSVMLDVK